MTPKPRPSLGKKARWLAGGILLIVLVVGGLFLSQCGKIKGGFVMIGGPQTPSPYEWQSIHEHQPKYLTLKLSFPQDHFYQGEIIPATLTFTNTSMEPMAVATQIGDRCGRIWDIQFAAYDDKGTLLPDPMAWFISGPQGGAAGGAALGKWAFALPANQWLRFDHPGKYTITVWTNRTGFASGTNGTRFQLVSDPVTITIDPMPEEKAKAIVDNARLNETNAAAVDSLIYLQTPEARKELRRMLMGENYSKAAWGLYMAPDPVAEADLLLADVRSGQIKADDVVIGTYCALKSYPTNLQKRLKNGSISLDDYPTFYKQNSDAEIAAKNEIMAVVNDLASKSEAAPAARR
jgi:hypothetical protein